ncbi:MAG TPA: hypothetical protein PKA51_08495, partial [Kiritimatiellia bacterium]|nr:hypothetical protein [Kiritimatiellia bacterium]
DRAPAYKEPLHKLGDAPFHKKPLLKRLTRRLGLDMISRLSMRGAALALIMVGSLTAGFGVEFL